ncbi:hypothetical protein [Marimonas arenosa]|uniref:Uncharacterized protein n=1 Tax=Marimonas arenosa TaxID=1795305 RepID=A0AAE4B4I3_9RHOB|nr:hypothetical protein [Marimonas arenosa]MDQ2089404.1 hypothetical protein [Marimonas arenosa]
MAAWLAGWLATRLAHDGARIWQQVALTERAPGLTAFGLMRPEGHGHSAIGLFWLEEGIEH